MGHLRILCKGLSAALLVAFALSAGGCGTSQDGTPGTGENEGLRTVLQEVRNNPENRKVSEVYCLLSISHGSNSFPYKPFFAGLFSVAQDDGGMAFCAALVEGTIAGEITEADLAPFDAEARTRGKEPLGILLRKLMVAHLRLSTQEAAAPRASHLDSHL